MKTIRDSRVWLIGFPAERAAPLVAALEQRQIPHRLIGHGDTLPSTGVALVHCARGPALPTVLSQLAARGVSVILALETPDTLLALQAGRVGVLDVFVLGGEPAPWERWLAVPSASGARHLWVSRSRGMQTVLDVLLRCAASDSPVLLRGESGTGKSALAQEIHESSPRRQGAFVEVSCPALPPELLAAELFGHTRGAFTGAVRDREGRVEAADGGTLFLDEIGELTPPLQAQLLRFLQDHAFERLGETRTRNANVRVVAATNRDLDAEVASGRFRLDLFYRLSVVDVRIPSLRERPEDLPGLAEHLIEQAARRLGRAAPALSEDALGLLLAHSWPGNVRELSNELERALVLSTGSVLEVDHLSERIRSVAPRAPQLGGPFTLDQIEREHIARVLERAHSFEAAAAELGIDDSTLWRKRKRIERGLGARRSIPARQAERKAVASARRH
ncbi:MAG: sigma 54-interacting transcriptional regulator [Polyangiaceae bacterium]|nr:sigma 54-interacting transcriptional regulator [Polyangiaceae bacterium]